MTLRWNLPGHRRWLDDLAARLLDGASVVVHLPPHTPTRLEMTLREHLSRRLSLDWRDIDATASASVTPLILLATRFCGQRGDEDGGLPALLAGGGLDGKLLCVRGQSADTWPPWSSFLLDLEQAAQQRPAAQRVRILALVPASVPVGLTPQPRLAVLPWRGVVGPSEVRAWLDDHLAARQLRPVERPLIREVAASLAAWDLELARQLSELDLSDLLDPARIAARLGPALAVPGGASSTWEAGLLDIQDGAPVVHLRWLFSSGQTEAIRRRIWRGQLAVLFPLLEESRLLLVRDAAPFLAPGAGHQGALEELEIGQIHHLLVTHKGAPLQLRESSGVLRDIRNQLAHGEVVPASKALHRVVREYRRRLVG